MYCRRCHNVKMEEERGTHHKKKKWRCPKCGRARMEAVTHKRRNRDRRGGKPGRYDE
ncbi:MAG: hypothetical protein AB7K09_22240 [Planctomycetota bacterium]